MSYRTIVVDDEPEAREGLVLLLEPQEDIEVVACCKNGLNAIRKIDQLKPDLVFLDIQMPKVNGFEVLKNIKHDIAHTVFVTAYDQYALKAFEVHAQDYLLKPFSDGRFLEVLNHARRCLSDGKSQLAIIQKLVNDLLPSATVEENPAEVLNPKKTPWDRLAIKSGNKISFVGFDEIFWIEGYDYCVKVHCEKEVHVIRSSLKQMEEKLAGYFFCRVSKSALVNMKMVSAIQPYSQRDLLLQLQNGQEIKSTRGYRHKLQEFM